MKKKKEREWFVDESGRRYTVISGAELNRFGNPFRGWRLVIIIIAPLAGIATGRLLVWLLS